MLRFSAIAIAGLLVTGCMPSIPEATAPAEVVYGSTGDANYISADGAYSIAYPADFVLRVGEKLSVDGVVISVPDLVSMQKEGDPSVLITIKHYRIEEGSDLSIFVAENDPCAGASAPAETRTVSGVEAIFFRDTLCGPYGYSLLAAIDNGFGYLIQIEAHSKYEDVDHIVDPILSSFRMLD